MIDMTDLAASSETPAEHRFTVDEYHRMAETGILTPDERVELIRGTVRRMSPRNRAHVIATRRLFNVLVTKLEGRASVCKEDQLVMTEIESEPEPDVMVCSNETGVANGRFWRTRSASRFAVHRNRFFKKNLV